MPKVQEIQGIATKANEELRVAVRRLGGYVKVCGKQNLKTRLSVRFWRCDTSYVVEVVRTSVACLIFRACILQPTKVESLAKVVLAAMQHDMSDRGGTLTDACFQWVELLLETKRGAQFSVPWASFGRKYFPLILYLLTGLNSS
eukprot:6343596-Amphidinium_carterae.1